MDQGLQVRTQASESERVMQPVARPAAARPMHIRDLDYDLPPQLIAQHPSNRRDQSRLLVLNRGGSPRVHALFRDLPSFLNPGDLLVLNNTRVLPARLFGRKLRTGGKWEGLFLRTTTNGAWELMCQTRGRPSSNEIVEIGPPASRSAQPPLQLRLEDRTADGHWLLRPDPPGNPIDLLGAYGHIPLPPYIRKGLADASDQDRYQTVFAQQPGSIAAPTAGLHFTPELFDALRQRGIHWSFVTLHVGAGTFLPIQVEDVSQHRVQSEWCAVSEETIQAAAACRQHGGRIIAVGTTTTRTLETVAAQGPLRPWSGESSLTIAPLFTFRVVDALITNFHLPRSSLLLLAAAFTGWQSLWESYRIAVAKNYRFYSYGDAMLIAPEHGQPNPPY